MISAESCRNVYINALIVTKYVTEELEEVNNLKWKSSHNYIKEHISNEKIYSIFFMLFHFMGKHTFPEEQMATVARGAFTQLHLVH